MTIRMMLLGLLWMAVSATPAQAGTKHYYYTDPQGTVLAKADAQGNIVATYDYAPYGAQVLDTPPSGPTGYTGHVNDAESGFIYMQQRYYDPAMGRFLSVDPMGVSPGSGFLFNRYGYVKNSPILNIDPDGRMDYDAYIRNQKTPVHIDDNLSQSDQDEIKSKVDAGIAKINDTKSLSKREESIILNVKSINVSESAHRSNIEERTGELTLTTSFVADSSPSWLASSVGHDGFHVELFNSGGISESRGLGAEVKAMGFQREIGMKMGLSSRELGYLETMMFDPQQLKSYIQSNP